MNKTIGFIGSGNMGSAIIGGIISARMVTPRQIIASDLNEYELKKLQTLYGIRTTMDNLTIGKCADILFLTVKPTVLPAVIQQIKNVIKPETVIVSVGTGQSIARLEELFENSLPLIRAIPNIPALVGEGMTALSPNSRITQEAAEEITAIFNSFGKSEFVSEALMDAVIGVSGSSPAFVYMMIEAMADAAVADGMPRTQAYKFAAQSVLGAAKMVLDTGMHPGALKDMVCSPGGTTVEGVAILEQEGFRNALIKGQRACSKKSRKLSKQ